MSDGRIHLTDLKNPSIKTLHFTWFAFFLTFVVWFSHAPMLVFIKEAFDLSNQQVKALMILNVAMTIPARIVIGILVDKFGPRHVYSGLLIASGFMCLLFATANSYEQLAIFRFLLGSPDWARVDFCVTIVAAVAAVPTTNSRRPIGFERLTIDFDSVWLIIVS